MCLGGRGRGLGLVEELGIYSHGFNFHKSPVTRFLWDQGGLLQISPKSIGKSQVDVLQPSKIVGRVS